MRQSQALRTSRLNARLQMEAIDDLTRLSETAMTRFDEIDLPFSVYENREQNISRIWLRAEAGSM